jgi:hypothetical protein
MYGFGVRGFKKAALYDMARNKATGQSTIFTASDDATHREYRRNTAVAFGTKVPAYAPVIRTHIDALIGRKRPFTQEDGIVNLPNRLLKSQLNLLFEVSFGRELPVPVPPPGEEDTHSQPRIPHGFRDLHYLQLASVAQLDHQHGSSSEDAS